MNYDVCESSRISKNPKAFIGDQSVTFGVWTGLESRRTGMEMSDSLPFPTFEGTRSLDQADHVLYSGPVSLFLGCLPDFSEITHPPSPTGNVGWNFWVPTLALDIQPSLEC